ncbi:MAG: 23S rRNA (uracil(1939)-C(5))-methyltransferase RlmD [Bradymonadales bacterium]|jgi:23S rRNA (uracil1939-C5)-methyltransferase
MNPVLKGEITALMPDGSGCIVENNTKISVPGALPGDCVLFQIQAKSQHHPLAWAKLMKRVSPGPHHVQVPCPHQAPQRGRCAGCPLMHMDAKLQAKHKLESVHNALKDAGIIHIQNIPYHESPRNLHYRNRSDWVVGKTRRGKIIIGAYAARSHDVVALSSCMVLRNELSVLLPSLAFLLNAVQIPVWPEPAGLRYISAFANQDGDVLLDFVFAAKPPASFEDLCQRLRKDSAIKGISYSVNDSHNNAMRIAPSISVWGKECLPERLGRVYSELSASNFTQLNSDIASKIYEKARQWAGRCRIVWDLYCGSGAMGRNIDVQKSLYGAELSARSIEQAKLSAKNDKFNTQFETLDLQNYWPSFERANVILLNPPRKGLSPMVIHQLRQNPTRLIYMSCNPQSFAQNARALSPILELTRLEAFDMLPQTLHVEVLGMFELRT